MNRLTTYIVSGLMAVAAASCSDERLWTGDDIIGEGEAHISAEVLFKNFTPALNGKASRESGGTKGNASTASTIFISLYSMNRVPNSHCRRSSQKMLTRTTRMSAY